MIVRDEAPPTDAYMYLQLITEYSLLDAQDIVTLGVPLRTALLLGDIVMSHFAPTRKN